MVAEHDEDAAVHLLSVVVPVYQGERHLAALTAEIAAYTKVSSSPAGHLFRVAELLLVDDHARDGSPRVIRELVDQYDFVRGIWLSRNFGQHAATLAGMASSGSDWIVTMDEDGQHDPSYFGALLDTALEQGATVVYAEPTNTPFHSTFRNLTSRGSKRLVKLFSGGIDASVFHSYRLILGEVGRSVAAYAGAGVYLDVALSWVAPTPAQTRVELRPEGDRASGYSKRALISHFWRLMLSSGTRALRIVSVLGIVFALLGFGFALYLVISRLAGAPLVQGWTSLIVVVLLCTGVVLFSLGVIAEYVGVAVNMAMGKPLYLITGDPDEGPLGRRAPRR